MNINSVVTVKPNPNIPEILPGDTVRVSARIVEGDKQRIQAFQGVVIRVRRGGAGASFTVRRLAYGVGVERTFPIYSPMIEKVEVTKHGKVRRAKLYFLRGLSGKASRIKEKRIERIGVEAETLVASPEPPVEPVAAVAGQPAAETVAQPAQAQAEPLVAQKTEQAAGTKTEPPAAAKTEPPPEDKK